MSRLPASVSNVIKMLPQHKSLTCELQWRTKRHLRFCINYKSNFTRKMVDLCEKNNCNKMVGRLTASNELAERRRRPSALHQTEIRRKYKHTRKRPTTAILCAHENIAIMFTCAITTVHKTHNNDETCEWVEAKKNRNNFLTSQKASTATQEHFDNIALITIWHAFHVELHFIKLFRHRLLIATAIRTCETEHSVPFNRKRCVKMLKSTIKSFKIVSWCWVTQQWTPNSFEWKWSDIIDYIESKIDWFHSHIRMGSMWRCLLNAFNTIHDVNSKSMALTNGTCTTHTQHWLAQPNREREKKKMLENREQ